MVFNPLLFETDLLAWYSQHKRDLPWRTHQDAYSIWISEMMLQQTQVATVIPYYERFLARFLTIYDLANADEQEVLNYWKGLGYYSRARNLHATAKRIVDEFAGVFPSELAQIKGLKGIGDYSAGAILSIAFHQPIPAVDGNVMRLMSRVLGQTDNIALEATKKKFQVQMKDWISKHDPSSYNQALMEMGALICLPSQPECTNCPVSQHCYAFKFNQVNNLPVKITQQKMRVIDILSLVIVDSSSRVLIHQRDPKGLLASMWEFPQIEDGSLEMLKNQLKNEVIFLSLDTPIGFNYDHQFSHIKWQVSVYKANAKEKVRTSSRYRWIGISELGNYPFSTAHQKIIQWMISQKFL